MPEQKRVTVVPSPTLRETEFMPGIGPDGTELPADEAQPLLDAGLVIVKPEPKPAPDKEKD